MVVYDNRKSNEVIDKKVYIRNYMSDLNLMIDNYCDTTMTNVFGSSHLVNSGFCLSEHERCDTRSAYDDKELSVSTSDTEDSDDCDKLLNSTMDNNLNDRVNDDYYDFHRPLCPFILDYVKDDLEIGKLHSESNLDVCMETASSDTLGLPVNESNDSKSRRVLRLVRLNLSARYYAPCGLKNSTGTLCFMNSVLQALAALPEFGLVISFLPAQKLKQARFILLL